MPQICLHCFVSGHVQGVFYRRETMEQAKARRLRGYVKNLEDGRVEALICGEEAEVLEMERWLWQGPPRAEVSNVETTRIAWQEHADFAMRT